MKGTVKHRVIEAALDLFYERGYHGVSVDDIVQQAGTSKGGFYHNFKSKEALLYDIHDVFISHVLTETKQAMLQSTTPIEQIQQMLYAFTNVFDVYKRHITVFYNESVYLKGAYEQAINDKRTQYRKLFEAVLATGKEQQMFRAELHTTITAMAIIGMVNWTYKWYQQDGALTMTQITHYFNDVILHGIVTPAYAATIFFSTQQTD